MIKVIGYEYGMFDSQDRIFKIQNSPEVEALIEKHGDDLGSLDEVQEVILAYIVSILPTDEGMFDLMASFNLDIEEDLTFDEKKANHMDELVAYVNSLDGTWSISVVE